MATPITGIGIGPALLKALGMDGQRVRTIEMRFAVKELVTVKVERLMMSDEVEPLKSVLSEYALIPKPSIIANFDDWFEAAKARAYA
jgi:hypothetical protein